MPPLPTIRLRVWHHSDFAPTPEDNLHLSNFLGSFETGSWHVQPAEVLTETCWDHTFVPVEVDIKYRPTSYYNLAEASMELRRFFRDTVETHVGEFFKRVSNTTALLVHMYPVGDEVADTLKGMLLCVNFLQPLAFESGIYVESHRLLEHSMLEEGVIIAADISARAFELNSTLASGDLNALKIKSLSILSFLQGRQETPLPKEVVDAWNKSLTSFTAVHLFSKKIKSCVNSLASQQGVSDHTLYTSLVLIRDAILRFSEYQKSSMEAYKTRTNTSRELIAGLAPTVFGLFYTVASIQGSPLVATATASALSALIVGALGLPRLLKCLSNEEDADKFGGAMRDFQRNLRMAQFGLAILFCHQTLKIPFSWLADGKGIKILESLGIDISQLKNEEFSEKFALDSLEILSQSYEGFEKLRDDITRHAGLKEYTEATMPSSTPDGNGDPMDFQQD
ncbi:hypothetical protein NCS57_00782700 [Fusarium keratoplasticum]|uniref:Uncharacterized protein n=1 Tax=Fusarium keratoplasticum TaxID=1328300 RepID=A0ACC0QXH7_9HYPO|nr:hypothetical protein NCS57_00782700 [Fusarium keratoplasticum]KAI8669669.1 hypothetical protein NCS57_00782700 [Fusarium keratoplasticum]